MKFRTTLILLVIFAALGGYVYLTREKEPPSTTKTETIPILELDPQTIYALEVRDDQNQRIRLEKEREKQAWHLVTPVIEAADLLQVTRVITDLSKLQATRAIPPSEAQALDTYGLAPHRYEVQLFGANGEVIAQLQLGDQNPARTARYVRHEGKADIYLVSSYLLEPLTRWITRPPTQPTPTVAVVPTVIRATDTPTTPPTLLPTLAVPAPTGTITATVTPVVPRIPTITATSTITSTAWTTTVITPVMKSTTVVTALAAPAITATVSATPSE